MNNYSSLIVANDAAVKVKNGYPWLNEKDVIGRKPNLPCIVNLLDKKRQFVAMAFCSPASKIFLRVFSTERSDLKTLFWKSKIETAVKRREGLEKTTDAYRIVYAESDYLPSIIIDKYNDIISFQITSSGAELVKDDIVRAIIEIFSPVSIIEKNNIGIRKKEGLPLVEKVVFGKRHTALIREGAKKFEIDVLNGQKTGGYLDYRGFRLRASELAGGRCLDAFCYQGWFACHIAGSAKNVVAIDASGSAIEAAEKNAAMNDVKNIKFLCSDVFEYLASCDEKFDFIHLDPPSFVKKRSGTASAVSGYKKLYKLSGNLINKNGIIFLSSCSHQITERLLGEITGNAEVVYKGIQDRDHPLLKGFPQSLYLKGIAVRVKH